MEPNGTVHSCCLDSIALKVTISVVLTTLIFITVAGNVVVCLAVSLNRRLRSLTNCFIVSLAATDLLLGLLVMPFSAIYQLSFKWSFGQVFCNIYTSLDVMLCTASILNLFMISLDRYCAVTDPLRYPVLVTPVRVAISLVFIWVISITLSFLSIHHPWCMAGTWTNVFLCHASLPFPICISSSFLLVSSQSVHPFEVHMPVVSGRVARLPGPTEDVPAGNRWDFFPSEYQIGSISGGLCVQQVLGKVYL